MQFNDTTNLNGVIQHIEDMTDLGYGNISGNTTLMKKFTAHVNNSNSEIWSMIFSVANGWNWDDSNNTDLPQATTNIVSGTYRYAIPSSALTIKRIEVLDELGNSRRLKVFTKEKGDGSLGDLETQTGVPTHYFLIGDTIEVLPKPNYSYTNGLKVYFDRGMYQFTTADTTKEPGFASPFHQLLPIMASIRFLKIKNPTSATLAQLKEDYTIIKNDLLNYYSERFKEDTPLRITQQMTDCE